MAIAVRLAVPDDFEPWFELFESVAAEGRWIGAEAPLHRSWAEPMFERLLASPSSALFVAVVEDALVGSLNVEDQRGVVELGMEVRDGHRGQGVGSALIAACIDWARQRGAHKVTLSVFPHNERAIGLYHKTGFVIEGHLVGHWRRRNGELWDVIPMGLALT